LLASAGKIYLASEFAHPATSEASHVIRPVPLLSQDRLDRLPVRAREVVEHRKSSSRPAPQSAAFIAERLVPLSMPSKAAI
jgi:hypothetical protein